MKRWYFYPFSLVFHVVISTRNFLYKIKILKSVQLDIPVINVGNLSVGGTGKSPMIMFLADFLSRDYKLGVLSRGYARKSKGYLTANYGTDYKTIGDEAQQLFERFRNRLVIGVSSDRIYGARKLIADFEIEVLLLDDAYQHRKIRPGLNVLLTDYSDPYFCDFILPAGNLRESRHEAKRADVIVITKCPEALSENQKSHIIAKIRPGKHQKIFFSSIEYAQEICNRHDAISDIKLSDYEVLLVTGIANPQPLVKHLKNFTQKIRHLKYKDHHNFSKADIKYIYDTYQKLGEKKVLITSEKDYVRLETFESIKNIVFYWPINLTIDRETEFKEIICSYVKQVKK
ncbi:MAG: tetraacyldisaccharide 4'-kinase [Bergeyella sp.]|nr:tetraacyldisaccharide 4'-kinase [Bergeyella sp.]